MADTNIAILLTQCARNGGSASKWSPSELDAFSRVVSPAFDCTVVQEKPTGEDCVVMRINDETAAVFALDWFPPVVDDPYQFGAIAAAAAFAPLYACGAKPITALNIMALPCKMGLAAVGEVVRGGSDKAMEVGAFVVGGHSIDDDVPKYGLAVFGLAHPDQVIDNASIVPGDVLFYTKPLGLGIVAEAFRLRLQTKEDYAPAIALMLESSAGTFEAYQGLNVHGAGNVAARGLAGQLHEMLVACGAAASIRWENIELLEEAWWFCQQDVRTERCRQNIEWASGFVDCTASDDVEWGNRMAIVCDPQTSGGLLLAIASEDADAFVRAFEQCMGRTPSCLGVVEQGTSGAIRIE